MELFPALRGKMGSWDYYLTKLSMRELAGNVKFAHEVYEDFVLDEAIQRALKTGRVNKEIVTYLQRQPHRFFSSIVIAALGGNPLFYPVTISNDPKFEVFKHDQRLDESFGVLHFNGAQEYYAIDGQHRLAAIRNLLDTSEPASKQAPKNFAHEEVSVVVIVPTKAETKADFLMRYRRLFSNLNRYAKPTDHATDIIMDEDDAFAIITRRLITDHPFFRLPGKQKLSPRIKTEAGKNLREGEPYFTSIETLYDLVISLLDASWRQGKFGSDDDSSQKLNDFKRFRPDEAYIDALYEEVLLYWNALIEELPVLKSDPSKMRNHAYDDYKESKPKPDEVDHLLFWPIGQQLLAELARLMLDRRLKDPKHPDKKSVKQALAGLGKLEWRLHCPPWRFYLLTHQPGKGGKSSWAMRDEDRSKVVNEALFLLQWLLGLVDFNASEENEAKIRWATRLVPAQDAKADNKMWSEIKSIRTGVGGA